MDSNHRCLVVGQESSPLDHGTSSQRNTENHIAEECRRKWTHRESHPNLRFAGPASSCWTMSPFVIESEAEAVGLEPTNGFPRHLFSRQAPHPAGWLPQIAGVG